MSTTTTLTLTSSLALSSYAPDYAQARAGNGVVASEWPWIGQYRATDQFEINQVMAAFDTTGVTGGLVSATLTITIGESYGNTVLEVREHDWNADASAFVPGNDLAANRLLGSAQIGPGGQRDVTISLASLGLTRPLKIVLAIADQRLGVEPTGDTTFYVSNARLAVTTATSPEVITTTGAGSWTVPAGVTSLTVETWGGGGASSAQCGGGGAYSAGVVTVTPGQAIDYFVAARQVGFASGIIAQDTWFASTTTVLAKGANGASGGQASAGYGSIKFSGGSGATGGGGGSASPTGNGQNGSLPEADGSYYEAGGSSPGAGLGALSPDLGPAPLARLAQSHIDGGGGGAGYPPYAAPGEPGGGAGEYDYSDTQTSSRGQIRISWTAGPIDPEPGDTTPPTITSADTLSVDENTALTHTLTADEAVTWAIVGGANQAVFSLAGATLTMSPQDSEAGATRVVQVRATDAAGNATTQTITVTLLDVQEGGGDIPAVTAWRTPGALASIVDGNRSWAPLTPATLSAADEAVVRATGINSTAITHVLRSFNFGFTNSDIPAGATVTGIEIEIVRRRSFGSGVPFARHARLSIDSGGRTVAALADQIGTNNNTSAAWGNTFSTAPYGSSTDMWGAALTPALIKQTTFGFDYGLQGGATSMDAAVDQIRMRVHFTTPGTPASTRRPVRSFYWL